MKLPELLSPAGDMECLKAAVQNGADCVYLGAGQFNARARATNFEGDSLKEAIEYAHLRNCRINLTLNTLLKNDEIPQAVELAVNAYNLGVDAIIIQDLGLAEILHRNYPQIKLHASTQMTVHNLEGVKQLERLGYTRVVLARELSIDEIKNIRANTSVELEVFIHGALCISYSGECLFSSIVGGRSGNRGECAQPCRMKYDLLENDKKIDSGYLMSPHDQTAIKYLQGLIDIGIDCFKIEGRLKSPEYVGVITRFYRQQMDEYVKKEINGYKVTIQDVNQVFNRGGLTEGHFSDSANRELIYKEKSNNIGLYLGKIIKFNENKGYITLKLETPIDIGDKVSINDDIYNISEVMKNGQNTHDTNVGDIVVLGRIKGNIRPGLNVYKIESKKLTDEIDSTFVNDKETKKIKLRVEIKVALGKNIELNVQSIDDSLNDFYMTFSVKAISEALVDQAQNQPLTKDAIIEQLSKTGNTQFEFKEIEVELEDNCFVPMSVLKDVRRTALDTLQEEMLRKTKHTAELKPIDKIEKQENNSNKTISVLFNTLDENVDYQKLENFDRAYIPYHFFAKKNYTDTICSIINKFETYLYMPLVLRDRDKQNMPLELIINQALRMGIKGFVVSHVSQIDSLRQFGMPIIANYSINVYNDYSVEKLRSLGFSEFTPSVELNRNELNDVIDNNLKSEIIVYGRTPLMTNAYCYLGKTNKCYSDCKRYCQSGNKYYLQDRMNYKFRIIPDSLTTTTTIYNSKITSYDYSEFNSNSVRIDFLDESLDEMQNVINTVKQGDRLEGNDFTNGRVK